ncbi:hypothetical protein D1871_22015 [Nakamurella silvestris]|nr:hypothetical protein D1871_22015 [Nakamurella silvestris]
MSAPVMSGLSTTQDGYQLVDLSAPSAVGQDGTLSFRLTGPDGLGVTGYEVSHEKELHLVVVRTDGARFRHVHPVAGTDGSWTIPWRWEAAGSYRIYADFVPTDLGRQVTLTGSLPVAGDFVPRPPVADAATAVVGDHGVTVTGSLVAGVESALSFDISHDGRPVTNLEPYLGAFGHLVALREGDLGYLHVHPIGVPGDGSTQSGPRVEFLATAPTAGKYLLYLDFQIDGQVRTAEFVVTAVSATAADHSAALSTSEPGTGHSGH